MKGTVQKQKLNKGQALVEFVILMPIIIMILFIIIDFSNIFYQRNHLEGIVSDVVNLKEKGKSNSYITSAIDENVNINYMKKDDTLIINVSKDVKLVTPFSSLFFDNPYYIETERTIIYE